MTQPEYVRRVGDTMAGDLHLIGEPGDETTDRTSRLLVESYQMAYRSLFGEGVRLMLMDPAAKNMISWYDAFTNPASPKPVAWVGAHYGTHLPGVIHQHWSVETTMSNGELHTRFSIDYGTDVAQVLFNRADVLFSASYGGKFRIGVAPEKQTISPRDLVFATGGLGTNNERRWVLRCDTTPETGGNSGSHLVLVRYDDNGNWIDAPVTVHRNSGHIGLGTADTGASRVTVKNRVTALRLVGTASSSLTGLLRMEPSTTGGLAVDIRPSEATVSPFVISGDGRIEWGPGSGTRDVSLSRVGA